MALDIAVVLVVETVVLEVEEQQIKLDLMPQEQGHQVKGTQGV
jgi:hypothetical protein